MYDLIAAEMTGVQFDNANGITVGGKPYNQAITVDNTEAAKAQFEEQAAKMQQEAAEINKQISENQAKIDDYEAKTKVPKLLVIGVIALGVGMILFKK